MYNVVVYPRSEFQEQWVLTGTVQGDKLTRCAEVIIISKQLNNKSSNITASRREKRKTHDSLHASSYVSMMSGYNMAVGNHKVKNRMCKT